MSRNPTDPPRGPRRPRDGERPGRDPSVFIPSPEVAEARPSRWKWYALGFLSLVAIAAVGLMVAWPSLHPPRALDAVEKVADGYLKALASEEPESAPVRDR